MKRELEPNYFSVDAFEDIRFHYEQLFKETNTHILYKVRNWRERHHPEFLTKGEIYFSRPNELNDPFDIHRPKKFDISIIDTEEFYKRLVEGSPEFLGTAPGRDSEVAASNYLERVIKPDPENYFLDNYLKMINAPEYNDQIGVLSLTRNILDEQLWGYYGGGLKGFAVGFDSMDLAEDLFCQGKFVDYKDEINISKIIGESKKELSDGWFEKNTKWQFESEFRFTRLVHDKSPRVHYYNPKVVKEIVLGPRIPNDDEEEIKKVWSQRYAHAALLKVHCDYQNGSLFLKRLS